MLCLSAMVNVTSPRPKTPGSTTSGTFSDDTWVVQVRQFLDEWHCRFAGSSLGKSFGRAKAVKVALDLLALNGTPLTAEEIDSMVNLEEDRLVYQLANAIPEEVRAKFDTLAASLQMMVSTASVIRHNCEEKTVGNTIEELENDSMTQAILKKSVVAASAEISKINRCTDSWVNNMDIRLQRLAKASQTAETAHRELMITEGLLEQYRDTSKHQSSKALLGMADGNKEIFVKAMFGSWYGATVKGRAERVFRVKFEEEIALADKQLMDYKTAKMDQTRAILMRGSAADDQALVGMIVNLWHTEVEDAKVEKSLLGVQAELDAKLQSATKAQTDSAKKVFGKICGNQDSMLVANAFAALISNRTMEIEERECAKALALVDEKMKAMMEKNKDNASSVLNRMNGATESGLVELYFSEWNSYYMEAKKEQEKLDMMKKDEAKLKSLKARISGNAKNSQGRVNEQMNMMLLTKCVCGWQIEARAQNIEKYYNRKIESKRKQLQSVHSLFQSFANQLDEGLSNIDSARGEDRRPASGQGRSKRMGRDNSGAVSLPNIHQKTAQA